MPVDIWTDGILLKHGSLITSISIELSRHFLMNARELAYESFCDNTVLYLEVEDGPRHQSNFTDFIHPLSPISVIRILDQCPNLNCLTIRLPIVDDDYEEFEARNLERWLIPLMKRMKSIKELTLMSLKDLDFQEQITSKIVKELNQLQKFAFIGELRTWSRSIPARFESSEPDGITSLARTLSGLHHLTQLDISCADFVDPRWCLLASPSRLTYLFFTSSRRLSWKDIQNLVQGSASTLLTLGICHYVSWQLQNAGLDSMIENGPSPAEERGIPEFDLPSLEELTLFSKSEFDLPSCF